MSASPSPPAWLLLPLPANAAHDAALLASVEEHCTKLPRDFAKLQKALERVRYLASYEPAVNRANALVWEQFEALLSAPEGRDRIALVGYARNHMPVRALARVLRRLAKDPDMTVRGQIAYLIKRSKIREVALPAKKDGDWNPTGWMLPAERGRPSRITRHKTGKSVQARTGVPLLAKLAQLRALLNIKSPKQLGYFLLASDYKNGPYTTHVIPKRDGSDRKICAPKKQLKWVQKQILKHILSKVPPHPAAHGFVNGRSTVSNATPHVGAELVVKFDLKDFFPTVHFFRVMGLFASIGYPVGNCMFGTDDDSNQIAPVLARLCCYTPNPKLWGSATLPQGAPTSPAVSNLVCRRLDARLAGLAEANKGTYTRYADDLTFSFKSAEGMKLGRFRWWVDQVCQQEGFTVNQQKFRVIRSSQRQVVTGIVVNAGLRVPRELRRELRAIVHNCEKQGVESQAARHPNFGGNVGAFTQYLRGIAAYLNMVQPDHGAALLRRVNELLGPAADADDAEAKGGGA
ncbi:reverse transcriptase family protein [Frigoriglobus tundricola]|uniref:RNA-directed DNA polymerase n=1 Tax=Frigoriglobus tundricola TaxID=2774151 RepID=A0A6M5Z3Y1_9BACT|nr:reverse transcriptase family protein [Frigoriglobus tundricola]QJX00435.1 Retron-type RNA-directed DNA polymerase [Frigoriglobus tundricola]